MTPKVSFARFEAHVACVKVAFHGSLDWGSLEQLEAIRRVRLDENASVSVKKWFTTAPSGSMPIDFSGVGVIIRRARTQI